MRCIGSNFGGMRRGTATRLADVADVTDVAKLALTGLAANARLWSFQRKGIGLAPLVHAAGRQRNGPPVAATAPFRNSSSAFISFGS